MLINVNENSFSLSLLMKITTRYNHHKTKKQLYHMIFKKMINVNDLKFLSSVFTQSDLLAVLENLNLDKKSLSQEKLNKIECQNN